eukprot:CAMPEP_0197596092 /NCGR_PEP_ID=MMETSP1326-20131121/24337_1 /TAXON_ID=1155430 /ORGANISM="Genus nov. species nov., Strain RCC2288" /LENGTH=347 /DNA_ID=CAMNT_0043162537 /DNA_START=99 /DNA_END=1139 /DNA_ORIENTATION=+
MAILSEVLTEEADAGKRDKAAFVAAQKFEGWRHGYYFASGDKGVGYYIDTGAEQAEKISAAYGASTSSASNAVPKRPTASGDASDEEEKEEEESKGGPKLKVDLFDWINKRLLGSFGGRHIVDTRDVKVQVVSLWAHGHAGVADIGPGDEDHIAVACDMGLSLEWRGTVYLGGSSSVLGSVTGRVKVSGIRLNEDGRVTCEPELLLMGEKSSEEKAREDKAAAERNAEEATAAAAAISMSDNKGAGINPNHGINGGGNPEDDEPEVVPMETALGVSLPEQVRAAMAETGVHEVCEVIARAVAAMVAHATDGEVVPQEMDLPTGGGGATGGAGGGAKDKASAEDAELR